MDEVSPVFATPYGLHLAKVTAIKPAMPRPFEEVETEVKELWKEEQRSEAIRELVAGLRASATIEESSDEETVDSSRVTDS